VHGWRTRLLKSSAVTGGSTPPTGFDRTSCKCHPRKRGRRERATREEVHPNCQADGVV
jgi:hypothetical protein